MQELANRLQISGPSAIQLADVAGRPIACNEELSAAFREGRVPLQASLTVVALRDVEQRKHEVESKKEELMHFQWQIVVDKMTGFSTEVSAVAAELQAIKDDCQLSINQCKAEEAMHRDQLASSLERECSAREVALKDVDSKLAIAAQALADERSARDVAVHQLKKEMENLVASLEAERNLRSQDRAETSRALQAMKHEVELEQQRNADTWNQHLEMAKRHEVRLDERQGGDSSTQYVLSQLSSDSEKLRHSVSQLEVALAVQQRTQDEGLQRRGDELSKAVRDEILGRENHFARFAKDLETAFQSLEAKMARAREDASEGVASLVERSRVLELRCEAIETELSSHQESAGSKELALSGKVEQAWALVDSIDTDVKASDVVLRSTVTQVDSLVERINAAESDLQLRPRHDFFKPQMEALQRACQKQEARLNQMEKDTNARFVSEGQQRDNVKAQLRTSVRTCLDKIGALHSGQGKDRGKNDAICIDITAGAAIEQAFEEPMAMPIASDSRRSPGPRVLAQAPMVGSGTSSSPAPGSFMGGQVLTSSSGMSTPVMPVPHATVQLVPVPSGASSPMLGGAGPHAGMPLRQASSPPLGGVHRQVSSSASVGGYSSPRPPLLVHGLPPQSASAAPLPHAGQAYCSGHAGIAPYSPRRAEPSTR